MNIVKGCKAIICNCKKDVGVVVNVISFYGKHLPFTSFDTDIWVINKKVEYSSGDRLYLISSKYLKRISYDAYDANEKVEWEELSDIFNPKLKKEKCY